MIFLSTSPDVISGNVFGVLVNDSEPERLAVEIRLDLPGQFVLVVERIADRIGRDHRDLDHARLLKKRKEGDRVQYSMIG